MTKMRLLTTLCAAALSVGLAGCFHPYRTANVLVRDATTGQPLPNVEVGTSYHTKCDPFAPISSTGATGPDGTVTLRIAPYRNGKHFYAKIGELYAFRTVEANEVERLPRWSPWLLTGNHSGKPADFIIDVTTATDKAVQLPSR